MKNIFLITIEILANEWDYVIGQEIIIPVLSNNAHNAESKFNTRYCGSEYPNYNIKSVVKCDDFIFSPMHLLKEKFA